MTNPRELQRKLQTARDHLNGAVNAASRDDLFAAGAYTRNAHKILDDLLGGSDDE